MRNFDFKFYLGLAVALAGVIVPIFLWQFDISSKSLSVQLVSSVALQPETSSSVKGLQVVLDGVKIDQPYLSTLEITNNGSKPIPSSDFETTLEIRLTNNTSIVRARISDSIPHEIPAEISFEETSKVSLEPLLLNPKDRLTFSLITAGGAPAFEPFARISGISKVSYEDSTENNANWKKASGFFFLSIISLTLYMIFSVSLVRPNTVVISRMLALSTMAVSVFSSSSFARRAINYANIDVSTLNLVTFLLVSLSVALPFLFYFLKKSRKEESPWS